MKSIVLGFLLFTAASISFADEPSFAFSGLGETGQGTCIIRVMPYADGSKFLSVNQANSYFVYQLCDVSKKDFELKATISKSQASIAQLQLYIIKKIKADHGYKLISTRNLDENNSGFSSGLEMIFQLP